MRKPRTATYATILENIFGGDVENHTFKELCILRGISLLDAYTRLIEEWNKYDVITNGNGIRLRLIPPLDKTSWGYNPDVDMFIDPDGNMYPSAAQMCMENNLSDGTVRYRLRRGVDLKRAISSESMVHCNGDMAANAIFGYDEKVGLYTVEDGIFFESLRMLCKYYEMPVMYYKIGCEYGIDRKELALNHPRFPSEDHPMMIDGVKYTDMNSIGKAYDISVSTIYAHMLKDKKNVKWAIRQRKRKTVFDYKDKKFGYSKRSKCFFAPRDTKRYASFTEMCRSYHVSHRTVAKKVCNGYRLINAMGIDYRAYAK